MDNVVKSYGGYNTFDYKAYADTNPDVYAAFGYDKDLLWDHYKNYGSKEGRQVTFTTT